MRPHILGRGARLEPFCVLLERCEKLLQPTIRVAMLVCPRPDSKFFHIIAKHRRRTWVKSRCILKKSNAILYLAEGNEISQLLQTRKEPHGLAEIFRNVHSEKLVWFETCREKRQIINHRVTDIRRRER